MTDNEVDLLLNSIDINKLERRDEQEVVGYFNALDLISGERPRVDISKNQLKTFLISYLNIVRKMIGIEETIRNIVMLWKQSFLME